MAHKLVIVESPKKAQMLGDFLGDGYVVESSIGHIRDLPQSAADTPAKIKDKPWGRLAVDVENGFEPYYVVPRDKKAHISKLKSLLKDADELYLATDEDREGEAIAWHLFDELKPKGIPVHRMVFHEITKKAILEAVANPRQINDDLVEAQEARRILDRLYGYEVSPVLWKKVMSGLSAGRVQSVATRLVVDQERERIKFRVASYWDVEGTFDGGDGKEPRMFPARLHSIDEVRVASGSDFGSDGELKSKRGDRRPPGPRGRRAPRRGPARHVVRRPVGGGEALPPLALRAVPHHDPPAGGQPQARHERVGDDVGRAAALRGRPHHLHAHRLDHAVGDRGQRGAHRRSASSTGRSTSPTPRAPTPPRSRTPRRRTRRSGPSGDAFRTPGQTGPDRRPVPALRAGVAAHRRLADEGRHRPVGLGAHRGAASDGRDVVFAASGRVITFHGFLKAYVEGTDAGKRSDDDQVPLPDLVEGEAVNAASLTAQGHETKPPARYTEATLIKELEDREIGRPSTYASIIGTIINRGYVYKKGSALVPAWIAFSVVRLLEEHFARQIDYEFTARMEDVLDEIAAGDVRPQQRAGRVLLRLGRHHRAAHAGHRARRHRRQGARDVPGRRPRQRDRAAGREVRAVPRGSRP